MSILLDPQQAETTALFDFAPNFAGQRVLEIGCGDGRLTWSYASQASHVIGLDPDADKIARAREKLPPDLHGHLDFYAATLEEYHASQNPTERFDLAILAWSL